MAVAQFVLVERYWQSRLAAPRLAAALVPSSQVAALHVARPSAWQLPASTRPASGAPASARPASIGEPPSGVVALWQTPPVQLVLQLAAQLPPQPSLTEDVRHVLEQFGVQPVEQLPELQVPAQFAAQLPPQPSLTEDVRHVLEQFGVQLPPPSAVPPPAPSACGFVYSLPSPSRPV
jgi:hypothetical protein